MKKKIIITICLFFFLIGGIVLAETLNAWNTLTVALPATTQHAGIVASGTWMYLLGGNNGVGATSTVWYTSSSANGTVGTWLSTTLPTNSYSGGAVMSNGFLYDFIGSTSGTYANATSTIYYTSTTASGGLNAWVATTPLPNALWQINAIASGSCVWAIGGQTAGAAGTSTVWYASSTASGGLGTWATSTPLPAYAEDWPAMTIANGYIYLMGGYLGAGSASSGVWYASLSAPAFVQGNYTRITASATSVTSTFNSANSSGNLIVVGGEFYNENATSGVITAVSDSAGNTYVSSTAELCAGATTSTASCAQLWYAQNIASYAASNTVTMSFSPAEIYRTIFISEYSGVATSSALDAQSASSSLTSAVKDETSGTSTTSGSTDLLVGMGVSEGNNGTISIGTSTPYAGGWNTTEKYSSFQFLANANTLTSGTYSIGTHISNVDYLVSSMMAFKSSGTSGNSCALGTWGSTTALPTSSYAACGWGQNGYVYDMPGITGGNSSTTIWMATSTSNGTISSWVATSPKLGATYSGQCVIANGYFYYIAEDVATSYYTSNTVSTTATAPSPTYDFIQGIFDWIQGIFNFK